eukprot:754978-Hanusia_phi.AAC.6
MNVIATFYILFPCKRDEAAYFVGLTTAAGQEARDFTEMSYFGAFPTPTPFPFKPTCCLNLCTSAASTCNVETRETITNQQHRYPR